MESITGIYKTVLKGKLQRESNSLRLPSFFFNLCLASSRNQRCAAPTAVLVFSEHSPAPHHSPVCLLPVRKPANYEDQDTSRKHLLGTPLPQRLHSSPRVSCLHMLGVSDFLDHASLSRKQFTHWPTAADQQHLTSASEVLVTSSTRP